MVAQTEDSAGDGVAAVEVDYEPLPAVVEPEAAMQPDAPLARVLEHVLAGAHASWSQGNSSGVSETLSPNVSPAPPLSVGDIAAGLRAADVVIERTYRTRPVHQSYMEPHTVTVVPHPSGRELTIWPSVQGLFAVRSAVARALNLPERQIHVEPVLTSRS